MGNRKSPTILNQIAGRKVQQVIVSGMVNIWRYLLRPFSLIQLYHADNSDTLKRIFPQQIVESKIKSCLNWQPHAGEKLNIFPHFFHTCGKKYVFQRFHKNKNAFISTFFVDIKAPKASKMEMTGVEPVSKHIAISTSTFVSQLFKIH